MAGGSDRGVDEAGRGRELTIARTGTETFDDRLASRDPFTQHPPSLTRVFDLPHIRREPRPLEISSMSLVQQLRVKPGARFRIANVDPDSTPGAKSKEKALEALDKSQRRLFDLQYLLYAENKRSLLVVLQAMDAAGKDGVIRHVAAGLNPQGCTVTAFKAPSAEELDHHFLWRIQKATPARGDIGIFNRSHY